MPFRSVAQEKWAFATHQKFSKDWASITDQKSLPQKVKSHHKGVIRHMMKVHKKNKYSKGLGGN